MNVINGLTNGTRDEILSLISQLGGIPKDHKEGYVQHILAQLARLATPYTLAFTVDFASTPLLVGESIYIDTRIPLGSQLIEAVASGTGLGVEDTAQIDIGLEVDDESYLTGIVDHYNDGLSTNNFGVKTTAIDRRLILTGAVEDVTEGTLKIMIRFI